MRKLQEIKNMNARMPIVVFVLWICQGLYADATIKYNNYDSDKPIYLLDTSRLAPVETHVQLLYMVTGDPWRMVEIVGTSATATPLKEPGYFDAGIGYLPDVDSTYPVTFCLQTWYLGQAYDGAIYIDSVCWTQTTMPWDSSSGVPTAGAVLNIPESAMFYAVPEPKTYLLGAFATAFWYILKFARSRSAKPGS